jgi:hypothetical protein
MPRYYFHFGVGKFTFTDSTGIELAGIANVRAHAKSQIRNIRAALPGGRVQDWSGWEMNVLDHKGRAVFVIGFDLRSRPTSGDMLAGKLGHGAYSNRDMTEGAH